MSAIFGNPDKMVEISIWSDLRQWLQAIIHHWVASAGCALVAVFQICYGIFRRDWPPILSWMILAACFLLATFLAWRDEHRKTIGKERRSILNTVVDLLRPEVTVMGEKREDVICALIAVSDEFGSEEDVVWVCHELNEHGHVDPFGILGAMFEPGLDGKRLKFLQDARVTTPPIRSMGAALRYVNLWAPQNGLRRKDR
jgi:hypothetical protein